MERRGIRSSHHQQFKCPSQPPLHHIRAIACHSQIQSVAREAVSGARSVRQPDKSHATPFNLQPASNLGMLNAETKG